MKYSHLAEQIRTSIVKYGEKSLLIQPVEESTIEQAEQNLGIRFGDDHKEFWRDIGCGLISRTIPLENKGKTLNPSYRFMSPFCIVDEYDNERFWRGYPFFYLGDCDYLVICEDGAVMFEWGGTKMRLPRISTHSSESYFKTQGLYSTKSPTTQI